MRTAAESRFRSRKVGTRTKTRIREEGIPKRGSDGVTRGELEKRGRRRREDTRKYNNNLGKRERI